MPASRWALSLFLVCHLISITLSSLPPAASLDTIGSARHPIDDPIARVVTPILDRGARIASRLSVTLLSMTRPIQPLTAAYVKATGLRQNWNMFSRPWTENRYARLRYYVASPQISKTQDARPVWMATEMVFPELRQEDRFHVVRSYRAFAWDKAFMTAMEGSSRRLIPAKVPSDLVPFIRYFANRYRRRYLATGERIVRTEVWLGTSPVRPRGSGMDSEAQAARQLALIESYGGPIEEAVELGVSSPVHSTEMQQDIVWRLEFVEE